MKKPLRNLHWTAQVTLTFLFKHMMAGVIGGIFLGFLLLYYDVSKLWTLISTSSDPGCLAPCFWVGFLLPLAASPWVGAYSASPKNAMIHQIIKLIIKRPDLVFETQKEPQPKQRSVTRTWYDLTNVLHHLLSA